MSPRAERKFDAVLFDLLTALLDSWTLVEHCRREPGRWAQVARRLFAPHLRDWRLPSLRDARRRGRGRGRTFTDSWRRSSPFATASSNRGRRFAKCSARCAAKGWRWASSRTAPRNSRPRRSRAPASISMSSSQPSAPVSTSPTHDHTRWLCDELGIAPSRCLFVAGSAYDLFGTSKVGLPTYWHDRIGMAPPPMHPNPSRTTARCTRSSN